MTRVLQVFILFSITIASIGRTETLEGHEYFRKVKLQLTGLDVASEEWDMFEKAQIDHRLQDFLDSRISAYLQSSEHALKTDERLSRLLRLRGWTNSDDKGVISDDTNYLFNNSLNALFRSLAIQNRSWDDLLLAKKMTLYPTKGDSLGDDVEPERVSDFGNYSAVAPLPISDNGARTMNQPRQKLDEFASPKDFDFGSDNQSLGGVLTTARFLERYQTSTTNMSLRRAAAVRRIFLCEELNPVILKPDQKKKQQLLMTGHGTPLDKVSPGSAVNTNSAKLHASDPACRSCHHVLEPVAQHFMTIGVVPANNSGIGEFAKELTTMSQYRECQVKTIWSWFVGEDIPLQGKRLDQVENDFDKMGRKTNDFVFYLLHQPEYLAANPTQENANSAAQAILRNCANCHSRMNVKSVADLSESHLDPKTIDQINHALDLKNKGAKASMPPDFSPWKLSDSGREIVNSWIMKGAPPNEVQPYALRFGDRKRRLASGRDLMRRFQQHFYFYNPGSISGYCQHITESNRAFLGDWDTESGQPLVSGKTPPLSAWITDCLKQYLHSDLQTREKNLIFMSKLWPLQSLDTRNLSLNDKLAVVRFLVREFVGRGILANEDQFVAEEAQTLGGSTIEEVLGIAILPIVLTNTYLSY